MAEPGDAAAFIRDAPFEVLKALLGRLSPKWILRMRSVCKAWRDKLCADGALLARLHSEEPPRPLLCFDSVACPGRYLRLRDYCVESLDLRSGTLRPVFRFPDSEFHDFDDDDLEGRDAPRIIHAFGVDYERMEENDADRCRQRLVVHASLDGYLLVSFVFRWYVINPATRHWVRLPNREYLADLEVVGFYEHAPSGDYRVLCLNGRSVGEEPTCWYHVLRVSPVSLRSIGRPISPAAPEDQALAYGVEMACISPPIQLKRNLRLHWPPQWVQRYHMLVFDTEREEFSWKRPPPVRDEDMRLLEFPTGNLGLSLSRINKPTLELWRLEDYENEVWVPVYRIQLAVQQMPRGILRPLNHFWVPAVVSPEGDVLIESSTNWVWQCDRNGNFLRQFWFPESATASVRHVLRESLLQNRMFREPKPDGVAAPPFFHWLCNDPSW